MNKIDHPSTIICTVTTKIQLESNILRIHFKKGVVNLTENCDIMLDQIRAIDNKRLIKKVGNLTKELIEKTKKNISILMDLD